MKNKKIDLWTLCQSLAVIILGVWLGCTVRDSARQEERIRNLETQNSTYLQELEELREETWLQQSNASRISRRERLKRPELSPGFITRSEN